MKNTLLTLLFICIGVVVGTLVAELTAGIPFLAWLSFGSNFGMASPVTLNLGVISLTFGLSLNLNISVIIFIVAALLIAKKAL